MPSVELSSTDSEPLNAHLVNDSTGGGLTGANVRCDVKRASDGLFLDFSDVTFKTLASISGTNMYRTLAQVDAVNQPGRYSGTALDLSAIVGGVTAGTILTVTYYRVTPDLVLGNVELRVVDRATATALAAVQVDTDDIQTRLPAALDAGRMASSVQAMDAGVVTAGVVATGAIDADALATDAVTEISDAVRAGIITDHGAGSYIAPSVAGLALEATLTSMKGAGFLSATDSLEAIRDRGDAAWITGGGGAAPTVGEISTQVRADLITDHGAGAWTTAVVAGLALEATLTAIKGAGFDTATDSLEALRNRGDAAWITADVSALATAAALAAVATDTTKARRALYNRRTLSSAGTFTLYADDAVSTLYTATVTDKDGLAISVSSGEPARTTALV